MEILLSVLVFALVAGITPGPNNIMVMTSGLNFGVRRTLPHYLGICTGFPAMVIAIGLGLGQLFEAWPVLHQIIKVAGITYLLYLAWRIANTRPDADAEGKSSPISYFQAVAFQWVNPKAWVMAVGALAAFTTVNGDVLYQTMWIGVTFLITSLLCSATWMVGGAGLRKFLTQPSTRRAFNWSMAVLLALSVLPMLDSSISRM